MKKRRWVMKKVQWALVATWLLFASLPCPAEEWAKTYGGSGDDSAYSVEQIVDSWGNPDGYVVAGENAGNIWVLRVGNTGMVLWEKTYGPGVAHCIRKTENGFVTVGRHGDLWQGWAMGLDNAGNVVWQKTFESASPFINGALRSVTRDGIAVGLGVDTSIIGVPGVCDQIQLLPLGPNGSVTQAGFYCTYGSSGRSIHPIVDLGGDPAGYVILAEPGLFAGRTTVARINESFDISFDRELHYGVGNAICQTSDRGYVLTGERSGRVWIVKLDYHLYVSWEKAIGGTGSESAQSIQQTSDGGCVLAGHTSSFGAGGSDIWVLKLDASGDIVWQRTYGGPDDDSAKAIQQTPDGGYIVTGETSSVAAGGTDCLILKLGANGQIPGCSLMGDSDAVVTDISPWEEDANLTVEGAVCEATDTGVTPEDTHAVVTDFCDGSPPYISQKIKPRPCERGQIVRIVGYNFGDTQGDSVVHIGPKKVYGPGHRKIKLWTDTKIKIKVPNYPCSKWEGRDIYLRKVWVTVNGVNSNKKRIRILKPDTCP